MIMMTMAMTNTRRTTITMITTVLPPLLSSPKTGAAVTVVVATDVVGTKICRLINEQFLV